MLSMCVYFMLMIYYFQFSKSNQLFFLTIFHLHLSSQKLPQIHAFPFENHRCPTSFHIQELLQQELLQPLICTIDRVRLAVLTLQYQFTPVGLKYCTNSSKCKLYPLLILSQKWMQVPTLQDYDHFQFKICTKSRLEC